MLLSTYVFFSLYTVRLVDGPTIYEGRVEVQHNGIWGTVCDTGLDLKGVQVLCRQLGFGKAVVAIRNSPYGQGTRKNWLTYLNCDGDERTVADCRNHGWRYGYGGCSHVAGARCSSGNLDITLWHIMMYYFAAKID